ncbi:uncharacterized protein isoform X2 [Choristoneura fumiferana]|uniref:uncharacterized protein isoform X2 n=1 Tax=Choristoneura fumiferana TaxID=7141 RepID=UPI003D153BBA
MFLNDKCWILLLSGICLTRAFNVYVVPDQEDVEESTEFPTEEEPTSTEDLSDFKDVTVDSGEYTTYIFQYENEQYMGLDNPNEKCFDDFTKCVTSLSTLASN